MVTAKLTNDDVKKIQELLKEGYTCKELGKKFGVSASVINRRAKHAYIAKITPLEVKNKIIKKIKEGYTKAEAAQMYNIPVCTVLGFTKGLRSGKNEGNHIIRKKGIELINRLMRDGCLISNFIVPTVRGLQRNFPMIRTARYKDKTFFYLEGREEETIEAFFREKPDRVIGFNAISEMAFLLGVKISKGDQKNLVERYKRKHDQYWESRRLIQRRLEDFFTDEEMGFVYEPSFRLYPNQG